MPDKKTFRKIGQQGFYSKIRSYKAEEGWVSTLELNDKWVVKDQAKEKKISHKPKTPQMPEPFKKEMAETSRKTEAFHEEMNEMLRNMERSNKRLTDSERKALYESIAAEQAQADQLMSAPTAR